MGSDFSRYGFLFAENTELGSGDCGTTLWIISMLLLYSVKCLECLKYLNFYNVKTIYTLRLYIPYYVNYISIRLLLIKKKD